jgi:hypothetical protein
MAQISFGDGQSGISAPIVTNNQQSGAEGGRRKAEGGRLINLTNVVG